MKVFELRTINLFASIICGVSCFIASFCQELWQVQVFMSLIVGKFRFFYFYSFRSHFPRALSHVAFPSYLAQINAYTVQSNTGLSTNDSWEIPCCLFAIHTAGESAVSDALCFLTTNNFLGFCMGQVLITTFTVISRYFSKRLHAANQLLCAGQSLGPLLICPGYQLLIESYGWRGACQVKS